MATLAVVMATPMPTMPPTILVAITATEFITAAHRTTITAPEDIGVTMVTTTVKELTTTTTVEDLIFMTIIAEEFM